MPTTALLDVCDTQAVHQFSNLVDSRWLSCTTLYGFPQLAIVDGVQIRFRCIFGLCGILHIELVGRDYAIWYFVRVDVSLRCHSKR